MKFLDAVGSVIPRKLIEEKNGLAYASWATLIGLSGRAPQQVATFGGGLPILQVFDSAVVAVDMAVGDKQQRTWLPILDNRNQAVSFIKADTRDISDTINRCRAKAIAMVTGHGLSIYAGYRGDGPKFVSDLHVTPECDPSKVEPLVSIKGSSSYLDWATALAAARIADEAFHWEVVDFPIADGEGSHPYLQIARGYLVGVRVTYKGVAHVEYLPIMNNSFKPIEKPNAGDWNKAIMRLLTKAIAVATGYGLSVYAGEHLTASEPAAQSNNNRDTASAAESQNTLPGIIPDGISAGAVTLISKILKTLSGSNLSAKRIQDGRDFIGNSTMSELEKKFANEALDEVAATLAPAEPVAATADIAEDAGLELSVSALTLVKQIVDTVALTPTTQRVSDARAFIAKSDLTEVAKAYANSQLDALVAALPAEAGTSAPVEAKAEVNADAKIDAEPATVAAVSTVTELPVLSAEALSLIGQIIDTVNASPSLQKVQSAREYVAGRSFSPAEKAHANALLDQLAAGFKEDIAA